MTPEFQDEFGKHFIPQYIWDEMIVRKIGFGTPEFELLLKELENQADVIKTNWYPPKDPE